VRRRLEASGQAAVEAALGIFLFVTILVFGIHFAEIGHISLKVQEAANAAVYDATSLKMHDVFAHDWTLYLAAPPFAEKEANARYEDFDALSQGRTTISQVFTQTTGMKIDCHAMNAADRITAIRPKRYADVSFPDGQTGVSCSAQADIVAVRLPEHFLDTSLANTRHYEPVSIRACAVGRPASNGQCRGRLALLLDDWGYSGPAEAQECALAWEGGTTCANQGFYDQASQIYLNSGIQFPGSASRLAAVVAGTSPIDEDFFFMSFRGYESTYGPFTETVQSSHGDLLWETTPYQNPYNARYDAPRWTCWLGHECK
jgi:hypothetical protein